MALAIVLILLIVGSLAFHVWSPWWYTEIASNWGMIDSTVDITIWVTGIVFVAVNLFMVYCLFKFLHKPGRKAEYNPENKKLEFWLTIGTAVGVAAMLAPGLVVWGQFVNVPDDAHEVEVVGQQWSWSYRYPGKDGKLGTVDAALISQDNPFGMMDDPNGNDDILVTHPQMHLPLGLPVKLLLRSKDVLHDYAVPQFRVKMDLVPGLVTYLWLEPIRVGTFEILCEELCGLAHHTMRGTVVVEEEADYQAWLETQPTWAELKTVAAGDASAGQTAYAICVACHGQQGESNPMLNAPKLAGQADWYLRRQINYFKNGVRGSHDDDVYGKQMAPMAATLTSDKAISDVIAYIETLPDNPSEATITGDTARGKKMYLTCGACHGKQGQGIWSLNAPRLAGMSDWYLATQLKNFKAGVRGAHHGDEYGSQMCAMARI